MKVLCPTCKQPIPAGDISLEAGWAKCARCNEIHRLSDLVEGFQPPAAGATRATIPERPFDAWAVLERRPGKLMIHIPATGMRAGHWAMFAFATFWTGFIAFWTLGALGVFFNQGGIQAPNLCFAAFSTPFWVVGIGMFAGLLWSARGTRTVYLDAAQLVTEWRVLFFRRRRRIDRADVQHARAWDRSMSSVKSNDTLGDQYFPYAVELVFTRGSFRLPCTNEAEQQWMLAQINDFLQREPYRPGGPSFGPEEGDWGRVS